MLTGSAGVQASQEIGTGGRAAALVRSVLEEYNQHVEPDLRLSLEPEAALYGAGGKLDSLGLLDLVTLLETELERELGRHGGIVEESLAAGGGAFRSVAALIATVQSLLPAERR
jgi:acyl carrier protein